MKTIKKILLTTLSILFLFSLTGQAKAATSPTLGTAASFAVLAGEAITNVPTSSITGNLGLDPAAGSNYDGGVTAAQVNGIIYSNNAAGPLGYQENAGLLTTAKNDLTTAYDGLAAADNETCTGDYSGAGPVDLTLKSPLGPGVYCADSFILTDNLTLTGTGVWIFRAATTIITSPASSVTGGDPCNVWWRAGSSATLDTTTSFIGNILALQSITMETGATLNGRALARNAAVTMDSNTINNSMCVASTAVKHRETATSTATPISIITSSPTIAPKLPNTGTNSSKTNLSWIIMTIIGASMITLTSAYILRRKKAA